MSKVKRDRFQLPVVIGNHRRSLQKFHDKRDDGVHILDGTENKLRMNTRVNLPVNVQPYVCATRGGFCVAEKARKFRRSTSSPQNIAAYI